MDQLIPWLLDEDQQLRGVPFSEVIFDTTGKKVLPFDGNNAVDQRVAKAISAARTSSPSPIATVAAASLGDRTRDVPIHSIRLPGLMAHEMAIFAGPHETLTISHDTVDRKCFMPGVIIACKKVMMMDHMIYGLENLL